MERQDFLAVARLAYFTGSPKPVEIEPDGNSAVMGIAEYVIELVGIERPIDDLGLIMELFTRSLLGFSDYPVGGFFDIEFNVVPLFHLLEEPFYRFGPQDQGTESFVGMGRGRPAAGDKGNHIGAGAVEFLADMAETGMAAVVEKSGQPEVSHCPGAKLRLIGGILSIDRVNQPFSLPNHAQRMFKPCMITSRENVGDKRYLMNLAKALQQRQVQQRDFPRLEFYRPPKRIVNDFGFLGKPAPIAWIGDKFLGKV
jgi:hypothetical protein